MVAASGVLKQVVVEPPKTASHHITIDPLVVVKAPTGPPVEELVLLVGDRLVVDLDATEVEVRETDVEESGTGVEACEMEVELDDEVEVTMTESVDVEVGRVVPLVRLPRLMLSGGSE